MRHVDARLGPMGALTFYLYNRFIVTKEYEEFDFGNNSTWFNRKLIRAMPQGNKKKRKRSMEEQEAIDEIEQVLGESILNYKCIHVITRKNNVYT